MPPQTLEPTIRVSTYYTDIIRNNFKQVPEAYFGTITGENKPEPPTTYVRTEEDKNVFR